MVKSHNKLIERVDKMATKKKKSGAGGFILGAALGAAAGAVAGVLTAPKSGKQTRADIARGTKKAARKVKSESKKFAAKAEKEFRKATSGGRKKTKTTKSRK
jgi:gas vesicle protein